VAVSVVHRDAAAGTNRLEAARQALQAQTAGREQAERRLVEAQATIRELQTQLAHARLARDEAVQRAAAEKQALAALQAELLTARAGLQEADQRQPRLPARPAEEPPSGARAKTGQRVVAGDLLEGVTPTRVAEPLAPARRRGRPRKVAPPQPEPEQDFVEWWKPGWKERLR
jgi:hypothetical protein